MIDDTNLNPRLAELGQRGQSLSGGHVGVSAIPEFTLEDLDLVGVERGPRPALLGCGRRRRVSAALLGSNWAAASAWIVGDFRLRAASRLRLHR